MKPFIFDEQEYLDFNSLGIAFMNQFDLAIQAIKGKEFIKFFKQFKDYKKQIKSIFYQSRYLQNVLSMIIYLVTDEHIFYVGHKRYFAIEEILNDIRRNPSFVYFAEDHGFSKTLLPSLQDEKLKADLLVFENNSSDSLAVRYFEGYFASDSLEPLDSQLNRIFEQKDPFKEAFDVFKNEQVQIALAHKFSLAEVIGMRKKVCPVFDGMKMTSGYVELPLTILENAFYQTLLKNFKKMKYKKVEGKSFYNKLRLLKKEFKSYSKRGLPKKIAWQEKLYILYLEWVDLYKLERVILKDEEYAPTIPYCDTYISSKIKEELMLEQDYEKEYTPVIRCEYQLNKLEKSLKNHWFFSFWSILISLSTLVFYIIFIFLKSTRDWILSLIDQFFQKSYTPTDEISMMVTILLFVGVGISIATSIFIFVMRSLAKRKYNGLCRLAYYRKNEAILIEKQQKDYEKLKLNESNYAKKIDRFYRFYGGIGMAGLSLAVTIFYLGLACVLGFIYKEDLSQKVLTLLNEKIYFVIIPPVLSMLLCFARHKKTAWSVLFTYFLSIVCAVGLVFLAMM